MRVEQAAPPGRDLAEEMARLAMLDEHELAEELVRVEQALRAAQAMRAATVTAVESRIEAMGYRLSGATETVAAITVISTRAASHLMDAREAVCARPAVWQALAEGLIDMTRAQIISTGFDEIEGPVRDALEAKVLAFAQNHTAHETRRYVTRLLVDHDPSIAEREAEKRRAKAWDKRHIGAYARAHGMADLFGYLPAGTASLLLKTLDEVARTYTDDRSLEQKRVDALEQILAEKVHLDIRVDVVIPADTLASLQDSGAGIDGFGPVDGPHARYLALRDDARKELTGFADANAKDGSGHTVAQQIAQETSDNVPLRFLLRSYAWLQANAQRSTARPAHPATRCDGCHRIRTQRPRR